MAVRITTALLVASLALFTGCANGDTGSNVEAGNNQNPGIGGLPGTAAAVVFQNAPPDPLVAGAPFTLNVAVVDAQGNVVTDQNVFVTLTMTATVNARTLFGQKTMGTQNGLAAFPNLFIDEATGAASGTVDSYTIVLTSQGLTGDMVTINTVLPGAPEGVLTGFPTNTTVFPLTPISQLAQPLDLMVIDRFSNAATNFNGTATATVISGPPGFVPPPNANVAVVNGMMSFGSLGFITPGDYTVRIAVDGFPAASIDLNITVLANGLFAIRNGFFVTLNRDVDLDENVEIINNRPNGIGAGTYQGLAFQNGQFYTVDNAAGALVMVDPFTGLGTQIGAGHGLAGIITDITANDGGTTLLGLQTQGNNPFQITLDTGSGAGTQGNQLMVLDVDDADMDMDTEDFINAVNFINNGVANIFSDGAFNPNGLPRATLNPVDNSLDALFGSINGDQFLEITTLENAIRHLCQEPGTDQIVAYFLSADPNSGASQIATIDPASGSLVGFAQDILVITGLESVGRPAP